MNYKRGSALIIVVFTMSIIFMLMITLLTVTQSHFMMSGYFKQSNSSCNIAEAGIERSVSIIKNDLQNIVYRVRNSAITSLNISNLNTLDKLNEAQDNIEDKIAFEFSKYFLYSGTNTFQQRISAYSGKNGSDGQYFTTQSNPLISFYTAKAYMEDTDSDDPDKKNIIIECTGHYGNSVKSITTKYVVYYPTLIYTAPISCSNISGFLGNSITVLNKSSQCFSSCSIQANSHVLVVSPEVEFKNSNITTNGKISIKGSKVSLYDNVAMQGNVVFDYDKLKTGQMYTINGVKNTPVSDSIIENYSFIPISELNGSSDGFVIKYIVYNDNKVLDSSTFPNEPGVFYVIIAKNNLEINSTGGEMVINGLIYCNGLLKIDIDSLSLYGSIVCSHADFKGNIKIFNSGLASEQLNEIISTMESSISNCSISIGGDYDFKCQGWYE
jgi:hypothetical protein